VISVQRFEQVLSETAPHIRLRRDVPLCGYTSFRIGGVTPLMAEPASAEEAAACVRAANEAGIAPLWLGRGTNMLISDGPLDFVVIRMGEAMSGLECRGEEIFALSGASMKDTALFARDHSLDGFSFAHGIPGSMGGGVYMNAGAYDGCMENVVKESLCADRRGNIVTVPASDHGFSYRHSAFMENGYIVLGTTLSLRRGDPARIGERIELLWQKRSASQPLDMPSAGSTFKRPKNGYAAALIDGAGLSGLTAGGAMVSPKHRGFVVNKGGASFADVLNLMKEVQKRVLDCSGILLEPEVRIIDREGKPWIF